MKRRSIGYGRNSADSTNGYDPGTGRFLSRGSAGVNEYAAAGGWTWLDTVQTGLDVAGAVPVFGEVADVLSGAIDLSRGDYVGAGLSFASLLPVGGQATGGLKIARRLEKFGEKAGIVIESYSKLRRKSNLLGQANHLNQASAFKGHIPHGRGVAIKLEGIATRDIGSSHYRFHESLEAFWYQFREGGARYRQFPTNKEYSGALRDALRAAGLSDGQVGAGVQAAARQRHFYGLGGRLLVPNIPGRINLPK